jgi:beta-lactamase regulating signal transducer with metallopeptidase domain
MTEWMMDTVIVTCALTALVLLIRRPVAQIFGPTVAYGLWLLPAARVIMPSLEREIAAAAATPVSNASAILYAAVTDAPAAGRATAPFSEAAGLPQVDWIQIAVSLWLGIAALIFVIQMLRYVAMREVLLADAHNLGKVGSVRLIESDQVSGPLAFGLLDRYIAVPLNFNAVFPPEEREMALAHEMAHHRSGDLFANLAAFSLLSLTWFNPLSWLAWQAFRFDQEAACDARVLAGKDAAAKHVYGRALARTAHDRLPTFATALNTPRTIIARLKNLTMQDVSQRRRALGKVVIVTAIAVIVPLTATIVPVLAQNDGKNGAPTAISTAEMTTGREPHTRTTNRYLHRKKYSGQRYRRETQICHHGQSRWRHDRYPYGQEIDR